MRKEKWRKKIIAIGMTLLLLMSTIAGQGSQEAKVKASCEDGNVGDEYLIEFGNYWQEDTNGDGVADKNDEKTPIRWIKWDNDEDGKVLLMAEKCLDSKPFHDTEEEVAWKDCTLRSWLNEEFLADAFSEQEQSAIVETTHDTKAALSMFADRKEDISSTEKVFIPDVNELPGIAIKDNLLVGDRGNLRRCTVNTPYCASLEGRYDVNKYDNYWLRNNGQTNGEAMTITVEGGVMYLGDVTGIGVGVRPMLYLDLSKTDLYRTTTEKTNIFHINNGGSVEESPAPTDSDGAIQKPINKTSNYQKHNYSGNWQDNVYSYLYVNDAGNLVRVEYDDSARALICQEYNKETKELISSDLIDIELPEFGGFFAGKDYYYVVVGQNNTEENDEKEVVRIIQYDHSWKRLGSVGLFGANTINPFAAGSLRMDEKGDELIIHTSHLMYTTNDGLNHQANLQIWMKQSTREITFEQHEVDNTSSGYVSHSFNQFVKVKDDAVYTVDHGDAYPRGIFVRRNASDGVSTNLLDIEGEVGDNYTGMAVGGLAVSDQKCMVALQATDMDTLYSAGARNVYLMTMDAKNVSDDRKITQITSYSLDGEKQASNPYLVSLSEDKYLLMWEVLDVSTSWQFNSVGNTKELQYVILDANGEIQGDVVNISANLSDCMPLVDGDTVTWYVTNNTHPLFYVLDTKTGTVEEYQTWDDEPELMVEPTPEATMGAVVQSTAAPTAKPTKKPSSSYSSSYSYGGYSSHYSTSLKAPGKVKGLSVAKDGKKRLYVSWSYNSADCFQIQYALNKSFTKGKKTKNSSYCQITLKQLKSKKNYFVRVRGYNKSGGRRKYGKWSIIKKCKTK